MGDSRVYFCSLDAVCVCVCVCHVCVRGHNNSNEASLLPVGNQTCKNLKLDAEIPIYVQAQQPEDRLESVHLFPFYSIQNLHV